MPDSAPPTLSSLTLSDVVDISGGDAPLAITVAADDDTAIDYVVVEFDRGVTGPASLAAFAYIDATAQEWAAGPVTATLTIDSRAGSGAVDVARVWVWDEAGRSRLYNANALELIGADTSFEITGGTSDAFWPEITALSLSDTVDVTSGSGTLTASVTATDDTEVAAVELVFDPPLVTPDGPRLSVMLRPEGADTFEAGAVVRDVTLTGASLNGQVALAGARVWDIHGRKTTYDADALADAGFDTGFSVTGGTPDIQPPELTNLVLPDTIDVSDGAVTFPVALSATDDSGIAWAQVYLDRALPGAAFPFISFFIAPDAGQTWRTGTVARDFAVASDATPGPVGITSVHIYDTLGNGRIYQTADMIGLGIDTSFAVVDGPVAADLSLRPDVSDGAVVLSLVNDGPAFAAGPVDLDLALSATGIGTRVIDLMRAGTITIGGERVGPVELLDLTAEFSGSWETGEALIDITVPLTGAGRIDPLSAQGAVAGAFEAVTLPPPIVFGTDGSEAVTGSAASEALYGLAGDDTLSGGAGDDTLTGGDGADTFAIGRDAGAVTVADFVPGTDRLDLTTFDRADALAALSATSGGAALLSLPGGVTVALDGLTQGDVGAADAVLAPETREGAVWVAQTVTLGAEPVTVSHGWRFDAPVAVAGAPGEAGAPPVAVRIHEVTPTTVTLSLDRPAYLGGPPTPEEVTLVVVEEGAHRLPDGTLVQAGTLDTDRTTPQGFERIDYAERFATAPAALTQVQTGNDPAYVFTRQSGADEGGLGVALQSVETELLTLRGSETVGWLAVESGRGTALAPGDAPAPFEAGRTGPLAGEAAGRHDYSAAFDGPPGLVAALSSFAGPDPGVLRLPERDAAGFTARAQEDQSLDLETGHAPETVDYLALGLPAGQVAATGGVARAPIGEVHRLSVSNMEQTVAFAHTYDDPVIVAQGAGFAGPDPVTVRLDGVTGGSARLRLQEPNYLDGGHAEEDVTLLVMEAGRHELADGTVIQAGLHSTGRLSTAGFDDIRFGAGFDAPPVLLSTVMTRNGPDWVVTRHKSITDRGFSLALQEEEALNGGGHAVEQVGWVAIEAGGGTWSGIDWLAGTATGVSSSGARHDFGTAFDTAPGVVANLATSFGLDPAMPRLSGVDAAGFTGWAQEEQSFDSETGHLAERLDYLAFETTGTLQGFTRAPVIAETGTAAVSDQPLTIALSHSFADPVVFAAATTTNGWQPATVRVAGLTSDTLTLAMQEPLSLDGTHAAEQVSWMVVEAGAWQLADGTRLEVGTTDVSARGGAGMTDVTFAAPFDGVPLTLAQVQELPGIDFLDTRQTGASATGFRVTLEAEEARNALPQPPQEVGWMAIDPGTGLWEGQEGLITFEAGTTGPVVTDAGADHSFAADFAAAPLLLSQMVSFAGPDPAVTRVEGLDSSGARFTVQEDQSADGELGHIAETVGYVGLSGGGLLLGEAWAG